MTRWSLGRRVSIIYESHPLIIFHRSIPSKFSLVKNWHVIPVGAGEGLYYWDRLYVRCVCLDDAHHPAPHDNVTDAHHPGEVHLFKDILQLYVE